MDDERFQKALDKADSLENSINLITAKRKKELAERNTEEAIATHEKAKEIIKKFGKAKDKK